MKYYVYTHTRLDLNVPFYIGIGTKSSRSYKSFKSNYYRAHRTTDRNLIWKRIVSKTTYKIDIVFESDSYDEVKSKEKELIGLYGKKSKKGLLSNITDGGEGTLGFAKPKGTDSKFSKPVYQYDLEGNFIKEWGCSQDVERSLGFSANSICNCCNYYDNSKYKTAYGYQWRYFKEEKLEEASRFTNKPVYQYDKQGNLIKKWNSAQHAAEELKVKIGSIRACCTKRLITYKNFIWKY